MGPKEKEKHTDGDMKRLQKASKRRVLMRKGSWMQKRKSAKVKKILPKK